MPRGRPRTRKSVLPPCVYESHGSYYHVTKGKWHPLGSDLPAALEEYGKRVSDANATEGNLNRMIDAAFTSMQIGKRKPLSQNTLRQYKMACSKLKHMLRQFARPEQIKQKDAAQVKMLLAKTPNMANIVLSFSRQVFDHFVESQLIDSNPFYGVRRLPEAKRTRLIKQDEWDKIYKVSPVRLQCVMDGLMLTGQRIGDVLGIDEKDLLEQGIYFKQQKTGKELIVAWNPQIRDWVVRCKALRGKVLNIDFGASRPRPLFRGRRGKLQYKTIYKLWVTAVEAAGIEDCNLHDNRAFSATQAKKQGLDPQKLLGHDDPNTTKVYLRDREIDVVQGPEIKRQESA
jgi:integrase